MIQRIQSLFLLAAIILQILFISFPIAHFALDNSNADFYAIGFKNISDNETILLATTPLYILCWAIVFLCVVALFLFKKRVLQMRMCIYTILLSIGMIGMLILNINSFKGQYVVEAQSFTPFITVPVVNSILIFLAFRGIRKDELLVKAYDRLR